MGISGGGLLFYLWSVVFSLAYFYFLQERGNKILLGRINLLFIVKGDFLAVCYQG